MTRTGDTLTDMRSAASINDADAEEHRQTIGLRDNRRRWRKVATCSADRSAITSGLLDDLRELGGSDWDDLFNVWNEAAEQSGWHDG